MVQLDSFYCLVTIESTINRSVRHHMVIPSYYILYLHAQGGKINLQPVKTYG